MAETAVFTVWSFYVDDQRRGGNSFDCPLLVEEGRALRRLRLGLRPLNSRSKWRAQLLKLALVLLVLGAPEGLLEVAALLVDFDVGVRQQTVQRVAAHL